jgi:hypothetical protein
VATLRDRWQPGTHSTITAGIDLGGTATWLVEPNVYESVTAPLANLGNNRAGPDFVIGAGGSVTQATSKSTNVTLNKRCGKITMNNASLGAGASVSFAMANSFITANCIFKCRNSGSVGTPGAYSVAFRNGGPGSVIITVTNVTGGALSEAIVLNFAVIPIAAS